MKKISHKIIISIIFGIICFGSMIGLENYDDDKTIFYFVFIASGMMGTIFFVSWGQDLMKRKRNLFLIKN